MFYLYLHLFWSFFKIGLFGFGGGYAMLSLIQTEMVTNHHWLSAEQFTDIVAISQTTPGPIGLNCATYVGYTAVIGQGGAEWVAILGACVSTLALLLPAFILMYAVSRVITQFKDSPYVQAIFIGLRPTIVGLLAAAVLLLMTPQNFGILTVHPLQFGISCALFGITFIGTYFFKWNPILMIVLCGVTGWLLYFVFHL